MTYSFVSADNLLKLGHELEAHLKLKNPLSVDQAYLRSSLLASHLAVLERNRAYGGPRGFYERSHVFIKREGELQPNEPEYLGVTLPRESDSYFGAKGILDAIAREFSIKLTFRPQNRKPFATGRCADVLLGDVNIGVIGQIHPGLLADLKIGGEAAFFEVDADRIFDSARPKQFTSPGRYPSISRDLSILVPEALTWQEVADVTKRYDAEYVEQYYGQELPDGFKSMTLRVTLTRDDRTPTESEANLLEAEVMKVLAEKVGAVARM
jgi:phenylalanyl-tRNA synthetase beta chain